MNRAWISERIASFGKAPAIVGESEELTFSQVSQYINHWMQYFSDSQLVNTPKVVIVNGVFNATTIGLIVALYIRKCAIVPLFDADLSKVKDVTELVQPDVVFNTVSSPTASHSLEVEIAHQENKSSDLPKPILIDEQKQKHCLIKQLFERNESGLILYSSGSTGNPKAILLSLDRLLFRYEKWTKSDPLTISGFLLFDHIGGFDVMMQCLLTGATLVRMDNRTTQDVCRQIEKHNINILPTTPTFLNMLLINRCYLEYDLSSLQVIAFGSEVMPNVTLKSLKNALPHVKLKQTYGMSELGVLSTESKVDDSLWIKIKKADYKIREGVLWIKSDTAMLGYLNAEDTFDEAGWLCTGDLAEVDGEYIKILGRQSAVINVAGEKVFPAEVEAQLLMAPFVKDSVVWGKKNPISGHLVAATIFTDKGIDAKEARKAITTYLKKKIEPYKIPRHFEFVNERYHSDRFKKINTTRGYKASG